MIISYLGNECFKISQGDLAIVTNPSSKLSADVTLFSAAQGSIDQMTSEKSGFVITGPGEYEIKDIFIKGFLSKGPSTGSGQTIYNTIYMTTFEGMKLCFLGSLSDPELSSQTKESLEDIDILFVPVGGGDVLDPAAAYKLAVSLEPKVIIPMHYSSQTLQQFIKEGGEGSENMDKLVVKKKDLEGKEGDIIVLKEE